MTSTALQTLVARVEQLATSTLANALDEVGLHANVMPSIKRVAPGFRFAGPAVTVREETGDYGSFSSDDFKVGAMIDAAQAGDVIVVAAGGVPDPGITSYGILPLWLLVAARKLFLGVAAGPGPPTHGVAEVTLGS